MKTILSRTRYLLAVVLMCVGVLLTCYSAIANARRDSTQGTHGEASVSAVEADQDSEDVEKRSEFLDRFFATGPGGVSPSAYANALAAARALPPSPLLQGRRFVLPETPETAAPWTSPISPPIRNSYGGNASVRVHSLAIDPINANVVYAGSLGGLAKTTDGGVTWRYLSDAWTSQSVSSIAVSPNASNVVYVGTGREGSGSGSYEVGLYRSPDGGTTWHLLNAPFTGTYIRSIAIDPNTRESLATVYVANGCTDTCGLSRSTNSGRTWNQVHRVHGGVYDVAIDASAHPSTLYITEDNGTFKSTDSGQSWALIHSVLEGSHNRLSVVNSKLYLLGPGDPNHNLYKSMDRGAKWTQIPTNGNRFSVFAVDPFNPNIIVGGNLGLYRTDTEGLNGWTEIGHWYGPIHPDQRVIAFSQTVPGVVYDGNDGGVVRSTNDGVDWTNLNQNLPGALMYGVALSADGGMVAGTQDNGVVFSTAGAPWDAIFGGDSANNLIDPVDGAVGYFTMYYDRVFRRFNRATPQHSENIRPSQFDQDGACNFFPAFSMNRSAPTHIIAACQHVVRTLDGPTVTPAGWTTIGGSLADPDPRIAHEWWNSVNAAYEAPSDSNVIYAVALAGKVYVTTNANAGAAASWRDISRGLNGGVSAVTVHPSDPQTAYLACNSGVYKTTNMGTTWAQLGIPNLVYHDVVIDPANPQRIFAACNAGVFASTDGGSTWGNITDGIPAGMTVTGLSFNAINRQLAASTFGRGVYMLNLSELPAISISSSANLATTSGL